MFVFEMVDEEEEGAEMVARMGYGVVIERII